MIEQDIETYLADCVNVMYGDKNIKLTLQHADALCVTLAGLADYISYRVAFGYDINRDDVVALTKMVIYLKDLKETLD